MFCIRFQTVKIEKNRENTVDDQKMIIRNSEIFGIKMELFS